MKSPLGHIAALVVSAALSFTLLQGVAMLAQTTGRPAAVARAAPAMSTVRPIAATPHDAPAVVQPQASADTTWARLCPPCSL